MKSMTWLQEVTGEVAMDIAKALALAPRPLSEADLRRSFSALSAEYVRRALGLLEALGLARPDGAEWQFSGPPTARGAARKDLSALFGSALLKYPPFITFATLLAQGYPGETAASITSGVYDVKRQPSLVRRVLVSWGKYGGLLSNDGTVPVVDPLNVTDLSVIHRLIEATQSEFRASMFVAAELGPELTAELSAAGVGPDEVAKGLVEHSRRPEEAMSGPGKAVEQYISGHQSSPTGPHSNIAPIADALLAQGKILRVHRSMLYGVSGYRNASSHGPDPDTGKKWTVSPEAALVGTLLALQALRSLDAYLRSGAQRI